MSKKKQKSAVITHVNATPAFLADPKKMAVLQKMANKAYKTIKKKK